MNLFAKLIIITLSFCVPILTNCQSSDDIELQNRYWTYRENFRKYFVSLGIDNGQGLPFSKIRLSLGGKDNVKVTEKGEDISPKEGVNTLGLLETGGDVTAYMAEYMGILASEYWLLQNQGLGTRDEMTAVKNELYFAINAIERLDKYSKKFHEVTKLPDINADGFFVRDDTEPRTINYLEGYNFPKVNLLTSIPSQGRTLDGNLSSHTRSKYVSWLIDASGTKQYFRFDRIENELDERTDYYKDDITKQSRLNEMSQDQLIGVLFGFKCIMKFVESYVTVDPDGPGGSMESKNLHAWVKYLTDKMMIHLTQTSYDILIKQQFDLDNDRLAECIDKHKYPWAAIHKNKEKERFLNRTDCYNYAKNNDCYCVNDDCGDWRTLPEGNNNKLAAHSNYIITNPNLEFKLGDKNKVYRGFQAFGFGYPLNKLGEEITGNQYDEVSVTLTASRQAELALAKLLTSGCPPPVFPLKPHDPKWWRDAYNAVPYIRTHTILNIPVSLDAIKKTDAAAMFIWLPAASGTWEHEGYWRVVDAFDREEADLFWSVLNDQKPIISSADIENSLLRSNCEAIQNEANESIHAGFNKPSHFSHIGTDGGEFIPNHKFPIGISGISDKDQMEYYNGMDWMLIYNFYRIADAKNLNDIAAWKPPMTGPLKKILPIPWKSTLHNNQNKKYNRLPIYQNSYCPCKSSYEFYTDRLTDDSQPFRYYNSVPITTQPYTPSTFYLKDMGTPKPSIIHMKIMASTCLII